MYKILSSLTKAADSSKAQSSPTLQQIKGWLQCLEPSSPIKLNLAQKARLTAELSRLKTVQLESLMRQLAYSGDMVALNKVLDTVSDRKDFNVDAPSSNGITAIQFLAIHLCENRKSHGLRYQYIWEYFRQLGADIDGPIATNGKFSKYNNKSALNLINEAGETFLVNIATNPEFKSGNDPKHRAQATFPLRYPNVWMRIFINEQQQPSKRVLMIGPGYNGSPDSSLASYEGTTALAVFRSSKSIDFLDPDEEAVKSITDLKGVAGAAKYIDKVAAMNRFSHELVEPLDVFTKCVLRPMIPTDSRYGQIFDFGDAGFGVMSEDNYFLLKTSTNDTINAGNILFNEGLVYEDLGEKGTPLRLGEKVDLPQQPPAMLNCPQLKKVNAYQGSLETLREQGTSLGQYDVVMALHSVMYSLQDLLFDKNPMYTNSADFVHDLRGLLTDGGILYVDDNVLPILFALHPKTQSHSDDVRSFLQFLYQIGFDPKHIELIDHGFENEAHPDVTGPYCNVPTESDGIQRLEVTNAHSLKATPIGGEKAKKRDWPKIIPGLKTGRLKIDMLQFPEILELEKSDDQHISVLAGEYISRQIRQIFIR